jgi:hypothetical protein
MEKAMKHKNVEGFHLYMTQEGKIAIEQDSFEFGKHVHVYLTYDQFCQIENWVFKNRDAIVLAWNEGVEDECSN